MPNDRLFYIGIINDDNMISYTISNFERNFAYPDGYYLNKLYREYGTTIPEILFSMGMVYDNESTSQMWATVQSNRRAFGYRIFLFKDNKWGLYMFDENQELKPLLIQTYLSNDQIKEFLELHGYADIGVQRHILKDDLLFYNADESKPSDYNRVCRVLGTVYLPSEYTLETNRNIDVKLVFDRWNLYAKPTVDLVHIAEVGQDPDRLRIGSAAMYYDPTGKYFSVYRKID